MQAVGSVVEIKECISIHFMWVVSAVMAAGCPYTERDCPAFKMSKTLFS